MIPKQNSQIEEQFRGISWEFPRNHSQELVLEKSLGYSSKQVTKTVIPRFCYLGSDLVFLIRSMNLKVRRKIYIFVLCLFLLETCKTSAKGSEPFIIDR